MAPGFSETMSDTELKSELRNLKLKIINNEFKFTINKSILSDLSKELSFIKKELKDDIISGSLVLKIYGLINRDASDIDILIDDRDKYAPYLDGGRYNDENQIANRLGYVRFSYRNSFLSKKRDYDVDFFENNKASYDIVNIGGIDLKIHNPLEILSLKYEMSLKSCGGGKHRSDLSNIFNHLNMLDFIGEYLKD